MPKCASFEGSEGQMWVHLLIFFIPTLSRPLCFSPSAFPAGSTASIACLQLFLVPSVALLCTNPSQFEPNQDKQTKNVSQYCLRNSEIHAFIECIKHLHFLWGPGKSWGKCTEDWTQSKWEEMLLHLVIELWS